MPVNFGDTIMEGSIEPSVKVQAPVQDNSGTILAQGMGSVARAVGAIAGSIFQQSQLAESAKVLTAYENELLDLADAVDQGMDRNEAMIRARNLRKQYLANAPALQDDFDGVWTNFAKESGLGHVVVEGTIEQQAEDARVQDAIKLGYPDIQSYEMFQARAREATAYNQQLSILQAQGGIVTQSMQNKGLQAVVGLAESAFPAAQGQINKAMADIESNPNNKVAIIESLNTTIGMSIAQLDALGGAADTEFITQPIKDLMTTFNKWANDEIENTALQGAITNTQLKYTTMYNTDPILGPVIASSKLINDLGLSNTSVGTDIFDAEVITRLREVSEKGIVNILGGDEASAKFSDVVNRASQIDLSVEGAEELKEAYAAIIDGTYVNERSAEGALGFKDTVEALGSPAAAEFFNKYGAPEAQHADKFSDIIRSNYEKELVPIIQRYWESVPIVDPTTIAAEVGGRGVVGGMRNIPMSQLLEPVWNGNAVEFIPKQEWADNPRVQALARDVNTGDNSIGVPLNTLIRAYANVSQQDAKTIWEQQFAGRVFGIDEEGGEVTSPLAVDEAQAPVVQPITNEEQLQQAIDVNVQELSLSDFNTDPELAYDVALETVQSTSASNPVEVANATSPLEFGKAFLGFREENQDQARVLSSFFRETAGIDINPAKTAWCAAFVDAILHATGQGGGTGALNARSYLNWGKSVTTPKVGDVVVFSRGDPTGPLGHVGFYAGTNPDGTIKILGGNQDDSVSFSNFDPSRVLGYRRAS